MQPHLLLAPLALAFAAASGVGASAHGRADADRSAQAVDRYAAWLQGCVKALRKDVPLITRSADAAARKFVQDGWALVPWGEPWFVAELTGRAGGVMPLGGAEPGAGKTIVLAAPRAQRLQEDLAEARRFAERGDMVILFGSKETLRAALVERVGLSAAIVTHAAPEGGLIQRGSAWLVPTDPPASIAAAWTWMAEFVAACTRQGKMPAMWQSIMVPGSAERNAARAGKRFEEVAPAAIPPGKLGREYLARLDANIRAVFVGERAAILKAVAAAVRASANGGRLYAFLVGHATMLQPGIAGDPGVFTRIYREANRPDESVQLTPRDYVLAVGYDALPRGEAYGGFAEKVRAAGATVAWSFTDYKPDEVKMVLPAEIFIDQHWPLGDAVVTAPGYDVRIVPTSGVVACGLYWAINAGVMEAVAEQ